MVIVAEGGADLSEERSAPPFVRARKGSVMAVTAREGDSFLVRTIRDTQAWVQAAQLEFSPAADPSTGKGTSFSEAVVVLDPGHGGANDGAQGPTGLRGRWSIWTSLDGRENFLEELDIVDSATGIVYPGQDIPPVGRVWVTRVAGPPDADYEAGLFFRATLAGSAGANALIAIHNNASPDGPFEGPGSETFYMFKDPGLAPWVGCSSRRCDDRSAISISPGWVTKTQAPSIASRRTARPTTTAFSVARWCRRSSAKGHSSRANRRKPSSRHRSSGRHTPKPSIGPWCGS